MDAIYIKDILESEKILDRAFRNDFMDDYGMNYSEYGLTVIGHYLGAGVAVILGLLLKQKYDPRVYSYSIPNGFVSKELALYCRSRWQ